MRFRLTLSEVRCGMFRMPASEVSSLSESESTSSEVNGANGGPMSVRPIPRATRVVAAAGVSSPLNSRRVSTETRAASAEALAIAERALLSRQARVAGGS
eukprot:scaffold64754_cov33-Tisochrysis_lutea.AAC.2